MHGKRTATESRVENVVDRIQLCVSVVPVPALARTTAIMLYQPGNVAHIREGPHIGCERERKFCSAALKLHTRPRMLCEAADGRDARPVDDRDGVDGRVVAIGLSDGSRVEALEKHLAAHSPVLGTMAGTLTGADVGWRERQTGVIALTEHSPAAVRGVLEWMTAARGVPKQEVAARLLGPELVVETARLCHFLDCAPLLDAALRTVREAVDVENAPSCLLLGRELGDHALEQRAASFIMEHLEDVSGGGHWEALPPPTRRMLRALASALHSVPGCTAVTECAEPRELLAMVAETLAEQQDRLGAARERQLDQPGSDARTEQLIDRQATQVASLQAYLAREGRALAQVDGAAVATGDSAAAAAAGSAEFVPGYEWQELPESVHGVPAGLQIELPLDGKPRRARIPPSWQLRLWLGFEHGYLRTDVSRDTAIGSLRRAAAERAGVPLEKLQLLSRGAALREGDAATAEDARLFERRGELSLSIA
jgi:hypothetical protein